MALPSSGAISLNQMHIEAGGTTGTEASINDADIRGLILSSSEAEMSFDDWYGTEYLDSQTVTVGTSSYGRGFSTFIYNGNMGSIVDGTCNFKAGATIVSLSHTGGYTGTLSFRLTGNYTNGGFTSIHIPDATYDKTFTRSSANFSYSSHYNMTSWTWNSTIDPFGTTGSTRVVKFL